MRGRLIYIFAVAAVLLSHALTSPWSVAGSPGKNIRPGLPPIVFVSRNPLPPSSLQGKGGIPGFGPLLRNVVVGGRLLMRRTDGSVHTLVDSTLLYDVADPCVSWDGRTIAFSGVAAPDSNWRIYLIKVSGRGFVQLSRTDRHLDLSQFGAAASAFERYDDFDPCWLPDGRIVFASTRYPSMASIAHVLTSNLFVMNADGSGLHRITSERNGGEEPTIDPLTGRIVFARWWMNVDRPSDATREGLSREDQQALTTDQANVWHAMSVNPDGNLLKLYAGFPRLRTGMQTYKPCVMSDGKLLSTFSPTTSLTPCPGGTGIRWFRSGVDFEHYVIGARPDGSLDQSQTMPPPFATDPVELSRNEILISYSGDGVDYGVYRCTLEGKELVKVVDLPGTLELEPQPVRPRHVPPILKDEYPPILSELPPTEDPSTYYENDAFRFDCMNIFANGAVDEPMPDAPFVTKGAKIRFFTNFQRQNVFAPDPSILIKSVDVFPQGGVHEPDVPADIPLFEQIVDSLGRVLRSPGGRFAHVTGMNYERIGGGTKCIGCHAGHSVLTVPVNGSIAEWFNAATSAKVTGSSFYVDLDGRTHVPGRVVDRQARTGGDSVIWVSNEGVGSFVLLTWEVPLEIRELVLYGISPHAGSGTNIRVQDSKIFLYYRGEEVGKVNSTGSLSPGGTHIPVPPTLVDAAKVVVTKFFGTIYHRRVAGLAEVETIARIR